MDIIDKILKHPKNLKVLSFLKIPSEREEFIKNLTTPDDIPNVSRWLDTWEAVWDNSGKDLPSDTKYMHGNNALLIHPDTGVIFVFSDKMRYIGIRQPNYKRPLFAEKNEGLPYVLNQDGSEYDLRNAGSDWIVANFIKNFQRHIKRAYKLAGIE